MRSFCALLSIYSLLHLNIAFADSSFQDRKSNYMKTIQELPQMAAGGLITAEGLDDLIERGKGLAAEEPSLDRRAQLINSVVAPLEQVRQGTEKLNDCIAKKDPNAVPLAQEFFLAGSFSKMKIEGDCAECLGRNPDWSGLNAWSDQILQISEEINSKDDFYDQKTMELKDHLYFSERKRLLVPYLTVKAAIEKEKLPASTEEVLKSLGLGTVKGDFVLPVSLPVMPGVTADNLQKANASYRVDGIFQGSELQESMIDDDLRPWVEGVIKVSRERSDKKKEQERQVFYDTTNALIWNYNEAYRKLHNENGEAREWQKQIEETEQQRAVLKQELRAYASALKDTTELRQQRRLESKLRSVQWRLDSNERELDRYNKNITDLQLELIELEQQMAVNPIINGSVLDREGRGRKAPSVREELFHKVENVTREKLTPEQMEKYLQIYYEASEKLLKKLDEWYRSPDPGTVIENTLYANPGVAAQVLSETPEMAGKICYFIEKAVKKNKASREWDEILDWAKVVAAIALILASGGAILIGGVAIAAAIGFTGLGLAGLGVASGSYNLVRGIQLRQEYHKAKDYLVARGYGSDQEVEEILKLTKRRFVNAAMDYGLAASSGLAMLNGIPGVTGGIAAIDKATLTKAGIDGLIRAGRKVVVATAAVITLNGCQNPLDPMGDIDGDGVINADDDTPYGVDDGDTPSSSSCGPSWYHGPLNADGCPLKYPLDKECFGPNEDLEFEWSYDGSFDLVKLFRFHWGMSEEDMPDSQILIGLATTAPFNTSQFGGAGEYYFTVSAVGNDMVETGRAAPIILNVCH